jgi:hypothetical protein
MVFLVVIMIAIITEILRMVLIDLFAFNQSLEAAEFELSEEAQLRASQLINLLPAEHPGIMEVIPQVTSLIRR